MEEILQFFVEIRKTGTIDPTLATLKYSIFGVHIQICILFHMSETHSLLVLQFKWLHWILIFQRLGLSRYRSLGLANVVFTKNSTDFFSQLFYWLDHPSVVTIHCEKTFTLENILIVMRNSLVSNHWPDVCTYIDFVLAST